MKEGCDHTVPYSMSPECTIVIAKCDTTPSNDNVRGWLWLAAAMVCLVRHNLNLRVTTLELACHLQRKAHLRQRGVGHLLALYYKSPRAIQKHLSLDRAHSASQRVVSKQEQKANQFTSMLSHLSALVMLRAAQPACGLLVPAQQLLGYVHIAEFATKNKPSPPYLNDIKKESAKKSKAEAKEKVPRALNAYAWYVKEHASARKGEASSAPELMKLVAQDWKGLSDEQKKPYNELAAKSKAESAAARAELKGSKGRAAAAKGEVKADKGPLNAYSMYHRETYSDVKASNPSMKPTDIMKEVAVRWRALPQDERDRRSAAARAAREDWKAQQPVVVMQ